MCPGLAGGNCSIVYPRHRDPPCPCFSTAVYCDGLVSAPAELAAGPVHATAQRNPNLAVGSGYHSQRQPEPAIQAFELGPGHEQHPRSFYAAASCILRSCVHGCAELVCGLHGPMLQTCPRGGLSSAEINKPLCGGIVTLLVSSFTVFFCGSPDLTPPALAFHINLPQTQGARGAERGMWGAPQLLAWPVRP